jgi:hypothetical protein
MTRLAPADVAELEDERRAEYAREGEDDPRENPCPECLQGEVVSAGPMEPDTGHCPYTCDQLCGFSG